MLNKLVVDISHYQQSVNPLPLLEGGVQMVILKVDDTFTRNGSSLASAGMPIAAYHWIDPSEDALGQVKRTLDVIKKSNLPVLAIFPDFEQWWANWKEWTLAQQKKLKWSKVTRVSSEKLSSHAKKVFEGFKAAGWKTIGYTRISFLTEYSPVSTQWLADYPLWLAYYGVREFDVQSLTWADFKARLLPSVTFFPPLSAGLSKEQVVGHQFTGDRLSLPGTYADKRRTGLSATDISLFDDQFLTAIGAVPSPKPLPESKYEAEVVAATLNVRSGPGFSYEILYTLKQGEAVEITEIKDGWAKIRAFGEEWCSETYLHFVTALPDEDQYDTLVKTPVEIDLPGVTYDTIRFHGADGHVLVIQPQNKRFFVTPKAKLKPVSQAASEWEAQIVVNGDGWGINGRYPNSIAASNGTVYQASRLDYRPWINISKDNKITFAWQIPIGLYNAVAGDRFLIQRGKYNEAITNVNRDPRTAVGLTAEGNLILVVVDGRTSKSAGLSFRELAGVMLDYHTVTAINLDGGGSSAMWIKDKIVNVPIDEKIPGRERAVANHLCVFINN